MTSVDEVRQYIRFQMEHLKETNAHHKFEEICLEVARARVAMNLMPATGPVSAGGDQGRDAESYFSALVGETLSAGSYRAGITAQRLVMACTLQQSGLTNKVRSDLQSICSRGEPVDLIVYFIGAAVPVAQRHAWQQHAREEHGVSLDVWDVVAISRELAEFDLFSLAVDQLHVPPFMAPDPPTSPRVRPPWYEQSLQRWRMKVLEPASPGLLLELRNGLRKASIDSYLQRDLEEWLCFAEALIARADNQEVVLGAQFEIVWARLLGQENLRPADEHLRSFFRSVLSEVETPHLLQEATILIDAGYTAVHRGVTTIPSSDVEQWHHELAQKIEHLLSGELTPTQRALLLSLTAYLAIHPTYSIAAEEDSSPVSGSASLREVTELARQGQLPDPTGAELIDVDRGMAALEELVELLPETPLFPVGDTAEVFEFYTARLVDHPRYACIRAGLDDAVERVEGADSRARQAAGRAQRLVEADRLIEALREIHLAKIHWWHGDTMEGGIAMCLLAAQVYWQLHLSTAAKQYALAAAATARTLPDPQLKSYGPRALFLAASSDHSAGQSLSAAHTFRTALLAYYDQVGDRPDWPGHQDMGDAWVDQGHILRAAHAVRPSLIPFLEDSVGGRDVLQQWQTILDQTSGPLPTEQELAKTTAGQGMGLLFSDLGPVRYYRWAALGQQWHLQCANERETVLATERFAATAQVVLAELARYDAHLLATTITLEIAADATEGAGGAHTLEPLPTPGPEGPQWRVRLSPARGCDPQALAHETLGAVLQLLSINSLLPQEAFTSLLEDLAADGLLHKTTVVRPYDELADLFPAQHYAALANRPETPVGAACALPVINPCTVMRPRTDLASSYQAHQPRLLETIAYRYATLPATIHYTLESLRPNPKFQKTVTQLRHEGWRDWHLLLAINNIVGNHRVHRHGLLLQNLTPGQRKTVLDLFTRPESPADFILPPTAFNREELEFHLTNAAISGMTNMGLSLNQSLAPPRAIMDFLITRYRYWDDDIPHQDFFA